MESNELSLILWMFGAGTVCAVFWLIVKRLYTH